MTPNESKKCPYCSEQILADAKKCKHCGEILDAGLRKQKHAESAKAPSPGVAAVLSFLLPGLGQLYRGEIMEGFIWLALTVFLYAVFFPLGIVAHIACIAKAYNPQRNINKLW